MGNASTAVCNAVAAVPVRASPVHEVLSSSLGGEVLMSETQTTVKAEFPEQVLNEMEALVRAGWFHDLNDLMVEAVRRLLDTHRPELMERFIREDVEWALRGRD